MGLFQGKIRNNLPYLSALVVASAIMVYGGYAYHRQNNTLKAVQAKISDQDKWQGVLKDYKQLSGSITQAKDNYANINLKSEEEGLVQLKLDILNNNFDQATIGEREIRASLANKIVEAEKIKADEAKKGQLSGLVSYNNKPVAAKIEIYKEGTILSSLDSQGGNYNFRDYSGKYLLKVSAKGFIGQEREIEIAPQLQTTLNIQLVKPAPPPVQKQQLKTVDQAGYNYSTMTVSTDRGNYFVHLMSFDLNAGIEMVVDTAAPGDCIGDCPVKPLNEYIRDNGAFAGITGTYFCPSSYPACADKTNSFFYKIYNTRLGQRINWQNGLGDYLPFLMIDKSGTARYYNSWSEVKDIEMLTGISCRPNLVSAGQIVVTETDLDSDKEKISKTGRSFLGLKGQTVFAGIVTGANLIDSAAVIKALGIDYAFNLDGGGTSALYLNGSYKVGPGRNMPNAILFRWR